MLPGGTSPSVHMAIQTARTYEELKVTLHKIIAYLEDHGALGGPSACIVADAVVSGSDVPANEPEQDEPGNEAADGSLAEELCAMIMSIYAQRRSGGSRPPPAGPRGG